MSLRLIIKLVVSYGPYIKAVAGLIIGVVDALDDGRLSDDERFRLMQRFWQEVQEAWLLEGRRR